MRRYYIKRGRFANEFDLCYADSTETLPADWERITRAEAIIYAQQEAFRRKYDTGFAYHAPAVILPYGMSEFDLDPYDKGFTYAIDHRVVSF